METPLLTTKLHIPSPRPNLVSRPRLVERLDAGRRLGHRLLLLSTPAGFGKTTLLSEWISTCDVPVAWLSLDADDNDPVRFLTYLIGALQTIEEGIGRGILEMLQAPKRPDIEELLTTLINQLNARTGDLLLILDDYHLITDTAVHEAVGFLLEHLPDSLCLVIAGRADPPLPVARLRAHAQLTELRQSDLRFNTDEVAAFLSQVTDLRLSSQEIAALSIRTEGWVAGLQLAALSMQGRDDVEGFLEAFAGSNRYILDYLMEEVLQRQPEAVQSFLLQTSILDRLTAPLCEAVMEKEDAQTMLEELERSNLFIVPLDDKRQWYRYHRLFGDLLRQRLQQIYPRQIQMLHRRASTWCEANGLMASAIEHALAAQDLERALDLVEEAAESAMLHSEFSTLLRWLEALPEDAVHARPRLCVYYALASVLAGRSLDAAQPHIGAAEEAEGTAVGEVTAFRALIATYRGQREQSIKLSERALKLLSEDNLFFRSFTAGFLGLNYLYSGDVEDGMRAFREAVRVSDRTGNVTIGVLARCHLAEFAALQGRLQDTERLYEEALRVGTDDRGQRRPVAGIALIGMGNLLWEWNKGNAAVRYLTEGIELARGWGVAGTMKGYTGLARIRQAYGDAEGARQAAQKAQQIAADFDAMQVDDIGMAVCEAEIWIAQNDLQAAAQWAAERGLHAHVTVEELEEEITGVSSMYRFSEYVTFARLLLRQGRLEDVLSVLEPLLEVAEAAGWTLFAIQGLALQAVTLETAGNAESGLNTIRRALSLAEPGRFVRSFIAHGEPMAQLLRRAAAGGIATDYVAELLAILADEKSSVQETAPRPQADLAEPLTEREGEILRFLPTHLSSTEIAGELIISPNTVRFHIKNIYGKLGVHSRAEAVARARELHLL